MVSVAEPSFVVFALLPSRIFTLLDLDLLRAWPLVVYPPCLTCTCLRSESSCNSASSHYWSSDLVRRWFTDCCLLKFFKNSINIYIYTHTLIPWYTYLILLYPYSLKPLYPFRLVADVRKNPSPKLSFFCYRERAWALGSTFKVAEIVCNVILEKTAHFMAIARRLVGFLI